MWRLPIALVLVAAELGIARGADLKPQVDHLVRQLSSRELSERTEAEEKLIALGPKILDLLPTFKSDSPATDAQKRDAVARIRQRLEKDYAKQASQATTITLRAVDQPVWQVLGEITRQSGNKFKDMRRQLGQETLDPKISVDFAKLPFWEALDKTLDQAHLTLYQFGENDVLGIAAQGENQLPRFGRASYAGPLRFEATRLTAQRELRAAHGESSLRLQLEIAWEPRMRPILLRQVLADVKATDDRGQPIAIAGGGELERPVDAAGTATEFVIPLVDPPRTVAKIASLTGRMHALLPGKMESFEFGNLTAAKGVAQHRAGVTVTLDEVRKNNDAWEVRVRAQFEKTGGALASYRGWILNNPAYLVGADKKPIAYSGFETTKQTDDEVGIAYLFDLPKGPAGLTFVYKTPVTLDSVLLDYELKNLPLP